MSDAVPKKPVRRFGVICCGVLEWRFQWAAERTANEIEIVNLPAGLHVDPQRLRADLQDAIDSMDAELKPDGIVLGYGLCGRGVAKVAARTAPLAIVRAEDCTAILLGSQKRYRDQFMRYPGTFYFSHGWVYARGKGGFSTGRNRSLYDPQHRELVERFGQNKADYISDFRQSWKRNYQRAAAIRFADDPADSDYRDRARKMASELAWEYEELQGEEGLFVDLVEGRWHRSEILVVRPGENIMPAPGAEVLSAGRTLDESFRKELARYKGGRSVERPVREGLGLGVDAGGTYTDSVIYDLSARRVLSKSKAPTTHTDLVVGVRESVAGLDREMLQRVSRVALSTTLATNAIVEGKGRQVGLLLMGVEPDELRRFNFAHKRLIPGKMSMEGRELAPIDPRATARAAQGLVDEGAEAIAVSGYAAVIDPRHEIEVARLVNDAVGLPVVCGHELARTLNLYNRGVTAALNARLIPLIRDLIRSVKETLAGYGLAGAPLMVVCGDGGQMLDRYAEVFPVEQILSGPAASVIGALELSGRQDAVVADMGGTTLDVAVIRNGEPVLDLEGARIGDFQTCVRAMRINTIGLGCDSRIRFGGWPRARVGPRRVVPVAVLAQQSDSVVSQLRRLGSAGFTDAPGCEPTDLAALGSLGRATTLSDMESEIVSALKAGPLLLAELARRVGASSPSLLPLARLEQIGAVIRSGVTPTDLLHVEGAYTRFNGAAAGLALNLVAEWIGASLEDIRVAVREEMSKGIVHEVLRAALAEEEGWIPGERSARFLVESLLDGGNGRPEISLRLGKPLVPIGAPVHAFFPQLGAPLGTEILLPEHAEVANAVGAIAGDVVLSEQVDIVAAADGAFHLQSRIESRKFFKFDEALAHAESLIRHALAEKAQQNGLAGAAPEFHARESAPDTPLGPVFLGVTLTGRIRA